MPIVIRPGSRRGGVGQRRSRPVPRARRSGRREVVGVHLRRVGSTIDRGASLRRRSDRPTSSRQTGDSVVNEDQTSTSSSSSSVAGAVAGRHAGDLARRRVGPVRQRTGVVGAEAQPTLAGVVALVGPRRVRRSRRRGTADRRTRRCRRVLALAPPHVVAHRVSLVTVRIEPAATRPIGQTSSSSVSLRPSAASIFST